MGCRNIAGFNCRATSRSIHSHNRKVGGVVKCSRCGNTEPNITCYVCWQEPDEGDDCFAKTKSFSLEDEGFLHLPRFPVNKSDT